MVILQLSAEHASEKAYYMHSKGVSSMKVPVPIHRRCRARVRRLCKQLGKGPGVQKAVLGGVKQVVWAWPGGPPHGNGGGT